MYIQHITVVDITVKYKITEKLYDGCRVFA